MSSYLKAQAALVIGSITDYAITILLVEVFNCWYVLASLLGNISGELCLFYISRSWVFTGATTKIKSQLLRFAIVWIVVLGISALGIYILTHYLRWNYILSKTIVSILSGTTIKFLLLKKFVFTPNPRQSIHQVQ